MVDEKELQDIINAYNLLIKTIDRTARDSNSIRAYGGVIRAGKGTMLEDMAKVLVKLAWKELGGKSERLELLKQRIRIPIKKEYIDSLKDDEIKEYILKNIKDYTYPCKSDVLVSIDNKPILEIECKTYTENAMMKRILVDCTLLKGKYPNMKFALIQLESQLGGDYSKLKENPFGSKSTHTLLSMFDIDLNIITLLEGERLVDEPIHKTEFFKPLKKENLVVAIEKLKGFLSEFI